MYSIIFLCIAAISPIWFSNVLSFEITFGNSTSSIFSIALLSNSVGSVWTSLSFAAITIDAIVAVGNTILE